jgi:hypothetical protein
VTPYLILSPRSHIRLERLFQQPLTPVFRWEDRWGPFLSAFSSVEAMKCFNPILYPGESESPPRARVVRARVEHSAEVKHGSVVFVVGPA